LAENKLAEKIRARHELQAPATLLDVCTARGKTMSTLYGTGSNNQVLVDVNYYVTTTCAITSIQDRAKNTNTPNCWRQTYIGDPSSVWINRNIKWAVGFWTAWQSAGSYNSFVGSSYEHNSSGNTITCNNSTGIGYRIRLTFQA
jgi:hypothetical protein